MQILIEAQRDDLARCIHHRISNSIRCCVIQRCCTHIDQLRELRHLVACSIIQITAAVCHIHLLILRDRCHNIICKRDHQLLGIRSIGNRA